MTDEATTTDEHRDEHPEYLVGAALLGGFVLAQVLKRLASDD
jgi:hypothetical protein